MARWLAGLMLAFPLTFVSGSLIEKGYETCGAIKGKIEELFHEAQTICQPGNDNAKIAIVLASPLPIFQNYDAKRAWFIASIPIVGYEARRAGLTNFSTLYMMDSQSTNREAFAMPIARAASLQEQLKTEKITVANYVSIVMAEMIAIKIPSRLLGRSD
jgi:hypothetical protein